jgi:hypothetical protein
MKFKVYDNGWNEGETLVEVSNDKIEEGDFYLAIGKPFNPKKHLGWSYNTETPDIKLSGSIELCDSVELSNSLSSKDMKIVKSDKNLNPPNQR